MQPAAKPIPQFVVPAAAQRSEDEEKKLAFPAAPALQAAPQSGFLGIGWNTWAKVGAIAAAFAILYWPNLYRLWQKTNYISGDRNWYHSMTIPLIGIYYLFLNRDQLERTPVEPILLSRFTLKRLRDTGIVAGIGLLGIIVAPVITWILPISDSTINPVTLARYASLGIIIYAIFPLLLGWGLGTLLAGLLLSAYGIYPGQNDFIWDMGMVLTLFGTVLTLCGAKVMRIAWFPIAFLICAIPWPPLVYSAIALPLQKLAAVSSVAILNLFQIDASYSGTKIFMPQFDHVTQMRLPDRPLNVAEACAGMVSLMTFISIGTAVAFLSSRPMWQKVIIVASAIPIAIFCNVLRVAGVGMLDLYMGPEWSEGFAHQFTGMVLMLPAFLLILLVCWILDHIFIEESDIPFKPGSAA